MSRMFYLTKVTLYWSMTVCTMSLLARKSLSSIDKAFSCLFFMILANLKLRISDYNKVLIHLNITNNEQSKASVGIATS